MDVCAAAYERQMRKQIIQLFGLKQNKNVNIYVNVFHWKLESYLGTALAFHYL